MPARNDEGRFMSLRARYDDDDDYRRGGRGHGGWYGDPEGHAEASRRGWEERGGPRGRYRDDDDDRRSARSRDDEGRFTSSRSRYADDDDDRRYARSRDDEGRFTSSRSRYADDDDDRRSGRRYGDPEGHSEAARRGRR
jgi:hypothetical protein